jgi:hypothetical protein
MKRISLFSYIALATLASIVGCETRSSSTYPSASPSDRVSSGESTETKLVAVRVTGMMCPHSCLKDVEAIIRKENDVASIELTPQKDPDKIDNPVVMVRYRGQLHQEETSKAIVAAGFEKVEFDDNASQ